MQGTERLASRATRMIVEGALNGRSVRDLASDLGVSERHLRRCMKAAIGTTPIELAQAQRLVVARRLLVESSWDISRVAYASGFQSLRRFNAAFRESCQATPREVRRARPGPAVMPAPLRVALEYRGAFAWDTLLERLRAGSTPTVERVSGSTYGATVELDGHAGFVVASQDANESRVIVQVAPSLVNVLVPLVRRLRHLFDLEADAATIDEHLSESGLRPSVSRRPGVRLPGVLDAFGFAVTAVLRSGRYRWQDARAMSERLARELGTPVETGIPGLDRLMPTADTVAGLGQEALEEAGIPARASRRIHRLAQLVARGELDLLPGADPGEALHRLCEIVDDAGVVEEVVARTVGWPDAFATSDPSLQRAAGADGGWDLHRMARAWRPWRAYAAERLVRRARRAEITHAKERVG